MTTEATLQALLDPLAAGGCWPVVNTSTTITYPYAVFYEVSGIPDITLESYSGLTKKRFQIDCFGTSYGQAKTLAKNIRGALDAATVTSEMIAEMDGQYDPSTKTYQTILEYYIWSED